MSVILHATLLGAFPAKKILFLNFNFTDVFHKGPINKK